MKLKTNIARLLAAGLLLNNIYFYSNANTLDDEIPGRYETLEGEYITIDDSTEGNLEEIEIFGNTVQDPNNLEDIQSVGDLYVDENGNPILDRQGREQYKIDIISSNDNLISNEIRWVWGDLSWGNGQSYPTETAGGRFHSLDFIPVKPNTEYTTNFLMKGFTTESQKLCLVAFYREDGSYISGLEPHNNYGNGNPFVFTTPSDCTKIRLRGNLESDKDISKTIMLSYGNTSMPNTFIEHQEVKTTILLPAQLQKVGDIADKLYWDNEKRRYVIEKNIGICSFDNKFSISNFNTYDISGYRAQYFSRSDFPQFNVKDGFFSQYKYLSDKFLIGSNNPISEEIYIKMGHNDLRICVRNDLFDSLTLEEVRNLFLGAKIYYPKKDVESIETNITSKFKIPTYDGKTHIYVDSQNGINPTLKVVVDRLSQISKNAVEEAELHSDTSSISLARMYVNMLPESLYKDQLHEQLNQMFSSDMVLDRKTATSNTDIYIKPKNTLSMSLNTNSVVFEGYSGTEDMEMLNAVNITINSSLPYSLNAYMPIGISNSDNSLSMNMNTLNIRESSETNYQVFTSTTDKVVLKDNCADGSSNNHSIDLKLASNLAHQADIYKTVIKFEAEQK